MRRTQVLLSIVATWAMAMLSGTASAVDPTFGSAGFAAVPRISSGTSVSLLGFVHLPLSGGYLVFSQQQDARAVQRIVASRFTETGLIDRAWGDSGTAIYAMPMPVGLNARVAVGLEGSPLSEQIYMAGLVASGSDRAYFVATFNASGGFSSFSTSGPGGWATGVGNNVEAEEIYAVTPGVTLSGGKQGLLVAGAGYNGKYPGAYEDFDLFQVDGSPRSIDIYSFFTPSREGGRISAIRPRADGRADVVGFFGHAFGYEVFDASGLSTPIYASTPLVCPGGATPRLQIVDDVAWPIAFAGDALLYGRTLCPASSNTTVSLVRMRGIDSPPPAIPAVVWSLTLDDASTACGGSLGTFDAFNGCSLSYLGVSATLGAPVLAESTAGSIARWDVSGATPKSLGNIPDTAGITLILSAISGADYRYPYLVCLARSGGTYGLVRVDVR